MKIGEKESHLSLHFLTLKKKKETLTLEFTGECQSQGSRQGPHRAGREEEGRRAGYSERRGDPQPGATASSRAPSSPPQPPGRAQPASASAARQPQPQGLKPFPAGSGPEGPLVWKADPCSLRTGSRDSVCPSEEVPVNLENRK